MPGPVPVTLTADLKGADTRLLQLRCLTSGINVPLEFSEVISLCRSLALELPAT
jgi:hypothetical protein